MKYTHTPVKSWNVHVLIAAHQKGLPRETLPLESRD